MQLSKRDFMERAWIRIVDRLPPDEPYKLVLCYNSRNGYMVVFPASWVLEYAKILLDETRDEKQELSWDRQVTHWMPLFPPNGKMEWGGVGRAVKAGIERSKKKGKRRT